MAKPKSTNRKEKPVDLILVITVLIMLGLGIIMVLSASSPSSIAQRRRWILICKNSRSCGSSVDLY